MVRGIGKKKGNRLSHLEPLSFVEISFHFREKYGVQTARKITADYTSPKLFFDPIKSTVQLFLAEMLFKALKEETPDEDLFDYLFSSISYLQEANDQQDFHLIFLMKFTRFLGFYPKGEMTENAVYFDLLNGEFSSSRAQSIHTLDLHNSTDFKEILASDYGTRLSLSQDRRRKVLDSLVEYYRLHLEGFGEVKSLKVLKEVFS